MKKITFIIAFLLVGLSVNAQFKRGSKEKIKALKIAYITEQLNLTESEAEKFWPLYNKYDSEMMNLRLQERMNIKKKIKEAGGIEALSENDAKEISSKMLALDRAVYETKQTFYNKLKDVISYKKIIKLEIAEKDFHRKLLRKYRGKHKRKE